MMNIRYYHEFRGLDNVLNRFEILTDDTVKALEIKASPDALSLEYPEARKLDPIRGSQATMNLISEGIFQFVDLHTDEMRKYLVKFYRAGSLYWIGWLDSELYGEELSATPPYKVTFKASDFNIMERLRYRDGSENRYTDIVPFITHIRRCLDKLGLPFNKLYIGCTTAAEGVALSVSETVLHQLCMMSDNFYDEDKEPMSCREVMEEILRPFGLMLVHKYGNLYIYDYNTIKGGLPMKRYGYSTFAYEADETVNFDLGNLHTIGFASTDSSYGFEEMINNVKITSSLYGNSDMLNISMTGEKMEDLIESIPGRAYSQFYYSKYSDIENLSGKFAVFKSDGESDITGCFMPYLTNPGPITPVFRVRYPIYMIGTDTLYYIRLKIQAFINTRGNPFDTSAGVKENENSGTIKLYCNLYATDSTGKILRYCDLVNDNGSFWVDSVTVPQGRFLLWLSNSDAVAGSALDSWIGNANKYNPMGGRMSLGTVSSAGKGLNVPTNRTSGYLVFEITNKCRIVNPDGDTGEGSDNLLPENLVKNMFLNDISMELIGKDEEKVSTDDYEFNSYINKNVKTDFDEVTLKCISANEEKAPIGKANVLRKTGNGYGLQLAFTRSGQKDILERLLMCTIHSNFTTKNGKLTVDIKMTDNPALGYVDYEPILSGNYLVVGCKLDFPEAKTTVMAVGYSEDTDKLSDIPYE